MKFPHPVASKITNIFYSVCLCFASDDFLFLDECDNCIGRHVHFAKSVRILSGLVPKVFYFQNDEQKFFFQIFWTRGKGPPRPSSLTWDSYGRKVQKVKFAIIGFQMQFQKKSLSEMESTCQNASGDVPHFINTLFVFVQFF